jgi:hypothetical protein
MWPSLKCEVHSLCKKCKQCEVWKHQDRKFGHLAAKIAESEPWEQCHVDLVGPFTVQMPTKKYSLTASTDADADAAILNPL